jgi:hypothetical protein
MRMVARDICVNRPLAIFGLYKMSSHVKSKENPIRSGLLLSSIKRMNRDGLSTLRESNVQVVDAKLYPLFTSLFIDVGRMPSDYYSLNRI